LRFCPPFLAQQYVTSDTSSIHTRRLCQKEAIPGHLVAACNDHRLGSQDLQLKTEVVHSITPWFGITTLLNDSHKFVHVFFLCIYRTYFWIFLCRFRSPTVTSGLNSAQLHCGSKHRTQLILARQGKGIQRLYLAYLQEAAYLGDVSYNLLGFGR
jgi:hypothetical protein